MNRELGHYPYDEDDYWDEVENQTEMLMSQQSRQIQHEADVRNGWKRPTKDRT